MNLEERLVAVQTVTGGVIKAIRVSIGDPSLLTTANKATIVGAINEVRALAASLGGGSEINDAAGNGDTNATWSADKIFDTIAAASLALETKLTGPGVSAALDTLKEFSDALGGDANFAATIATAMNNRVRFDAPQVLTASQRLQACENIGIGNPDVDLVAVFNAALV